MNMSTKTIILSSSGVKNLIRKSVDDKNNCNIIYGEKEIIINHQYHIFIFHILQSPQLN